MGLGVPGQVIDKRDNGVAIATLNRPDKRNAVDDTMHDELAALPRDVDDDAQVKVLVYPEGGVAESIEQRPQVKCEVEYFENLRGEAVAADPDKKSGKDAEAAE